MIEETALVVGTGEGYAWVETRRRSSCDTCAANKGCGTATLARVLGRRRSRVRVLNPVNAREGEWVVIGIEEHALVRGSMAVYAIPVAGVLGGAVFGEFMAGRLLVANVEAMTILSSLAGMAAGLAWLRYFTRSIRYDRRYQPVVLHRQVDNGSLRPDSTDSTKSQLSSS